MMDNKLNELSNPAWIVGQQEIADFMRGDEVLLVRGYDPESTEPALRMYSQEYVSALTQRIAELESANKSQDDHINQQQDRIESLEKKNGDLGRELQEAGKRIAELEILLVRNRKRAKKLGELLDTPVRLTEERTLWAGEDDYDTGHVKGWNANRIEQAALLKKQGFTVAEDA